MIHLVSKPIRQLLAVSLVIVVLAFIAGVVVIPITSRIADLKEGIERERDVFGRLTSIVEDHDGVRKLEQRAEAVRQAGVFIEGESEPIRLASLQSQLAQIMEGNNIKPRSTRALPGRDRNDLHLVGAQLQVVAPIDKLQKILLDIEAHKPVLLIDYMQITPASMSGIANDEDAAQLDARFDVYAVEARKGS